jgi:FAD/FMN-containing dehydrogenase
MEIIAKDLRNLSESLAKASARRSHVNAIDLGALRAIREYSPDDMTISVESGMGFSELQMQLVRQGQWLPLDPPLPQHWTVRGLIEENPSGPRRNAYGTLRDAVIGLEAVRSDGQCLKSGGRVVKNVAGFDLCKLLIGSGGSLAVVSMVTFKLMPLPECETVWVCHVSDAEELVDIAQPFRSGSTSMPPVIFDFFRGSDAVEKRLFGTLVIGYSGNSDAVDRASSELNQTKRQWIRYAHWARGGLEPLPASLLYQEAFWKDYPSRRPTMESVLPTRLPQVIDRLERQESCLARMGQGTLYHFHPRLVEVSSRAHFLETRLKEVFDPHAILPALP